MALVNITHPVVRATGVFIRTDEIVVEVRRGVIVARLKARPSERYTIDYADLFETLRQRAAKAKALDTLKQRRR